MGLINKQLNPLIAAQYLVIAALVSISFSPPLTNIFIGLSIVLVALSSDIRTNLLTFFKTKLGYASLGFILVLFSGLIYGIAERDVIASSIWGWRKFLLLPIAAAVFMNSPNGKQKAINAFLVICTLLTAYSYLTYFIPELAPKRYPPGIVVRNYATQGLFFAVATLIAIANFLQPRTNALQKKIYVLCAIALVSNIALITTGRSGYIALSILLVSFIISHYRDTSLLKRIVMSLSSLIVIFIILISSPTSNQKLLQAKYEFQNEVDQNQETSIGYRLTFWSNTVQLIPKYSLIGTGTGGFEKAYAEQVDGKTGTSGVVTGDPHNQYLKILIEHGIIGLLFFCSLLILLAKQKCTSPYRDIGLATLLAFATTGLFNSHFSTFNEGQFIWIFTGCLLASESNTSSNIT